MGRVSSVVAAVKAVPAAEQTATAAAAAAVWEPVAPVQCITGSARRSAPRLGGLYPPCRSPHTVRGATLWTLGSAQKRRRRRGHRPRRDSVVSGPGGLVVLVCCLCGCRVLAVVVPALFPAMVVAPAAAAAVATAAATTAVVPGVQPALRHVRRSRAIRFRSVTLRPAHLLWCQRPHSEQRTDAPPNLRQQVPHW